MITVSQSHYESLMKLCELTTRNISLVHPSLSELSAALNAINLSLTGLYTRISSQLAGIVGLNHQLELAKGESLKKIQHLLSEKTKLAKSNIKLHSELYRNTNEHNKIEQLFKVCKEELKATIERLVLKSQKYKKMYQQTNKKCKELEAKAREYTVLESSHRKEQQLDEELQMLQSELKKLDNSFNQ